MSLLHWRHCPATALVASLSQQTGGNCFRSTSFTSFSTGSQWFLKIHFWCPLYCSKRKLNTSSPQLQQKIYESSSHFSLEFSLITQQHKCVNIYSKQKRTQIGTKKIRKTNGLFMSNYVALYKHLFIQNSSAGWTSHVATMSIM